MIQTLKKIIYENKDNKDSSTESEKQQQKINDEACVIY